MTQIKYTARIISVNSDQIPRHTSFFWLSIPYPHPCLSLISLCKNTGSNQKILALTYCKYLIRINYNISLRLTPKFF